MVAFVTPTKYLVTGTADTLTGWDLTGATVGSYYRLQIGTTGMGNVTGPATASFNMAGVNSGFLPAAGGSQAYTLFVSPTLAGTYVTTGLTCTIFTITPPVVNNTQTFNTTTLSASITHTPNMTSNGVGGSLLYAATASATYSTGATWASTVTVTRGTSYYIWARLVHTDPTNAAYASSSFADATATAVTVPFVTVLPDTAVTVTTVAPVTGYINGVMPATETTTLFTVAGTTTSSQYSGFINLDGIPRVTVTGNTGSNIGLTFPSTAMPPWGSSATSYYIAAKIAPSSGGDTNANNGYSVCTGTINGGTAGNLVWTMARRVYDPTAVSATLSTTFTTTATVTVAATFINGTPQYSSDNTTWQASNTFTGLTRSASQLFYVKALGTAAGTDSNTVTTAAINTFNQPDIAIAASGAVIGTTLTAGDTANYNIDITGDSTGTTYRILENSVYAGGVDGNGATASAISLVYVDGALPTAGTTSTYVIQAGVTPANGGTDVYTNCTGTNTTFTIARAAAAGTTLTVGTVSRSPTGDLTGGNVADVVVTLTAGVINHKYKLVRTSPAPDADYAVGSVLVASGSTTLTLAYAENDLPTQNSIWTYKVQVVREVANGGDGVWYDATGTGVSFTILRIWEPIVAEPQNFDTTTNSSTISHSIELKSDGAGGTLQYNVTTTATYPSTGWAASPTFTFTRLADYYLWARRSTDLADYDVTALLEVPAYSGSGNTSDVYGLQVYNSVGTLILDTSSRTMRLLASGSLAVPAGGTGSQTVTGFNSSATSHVVIQTETTDGTGVKVTSDYGTQTFSVINNSSTVAKTVQYFVFKSDN